MKTDSGLIVSAAIALLSFGLVAPCTNAFAQSPAKPTLTISGKIIDPETGRGVAAVSVTSLEFIEGKWSQVVDSKKTDKDGRYRLLAKPATMIVQPSLCPKRYANPSQDECPKIAITKDHDWPDITLRLAIKIDAIVVDPAGKPVAGASVDALEAGSAGQASGAFAKSAGDGVVALEQLDPTDLIFIRAWTETATTDGVVVIPPGKIKGRLTLKVDPANACRAKGLVLDQTGTALAGAQVEIWGEREIASQKTTLSGTLSHLCQTLKTDASGRFVSIALCPGDRYHVEIQAEAHSKAESPELRGRAGETHDLGTFQLISTNGFLAGKVVDKIGKPLTDVLIFNRMDALVPTEVRSDAGGKFRLDGLFVGPKLAFARKGGYRFTAIDVDRNADDLQVVLLGEDDPFPAWKPRPASSYETDKAVAKRCLTRLWRKFGKNADQNGAYKCIDSMALIDPATARAWSAELGGKYDAQIRIEAAEVAAETDIDLALELLALPDAGATQSALQRLAQRYVETNPKKALAFIEETTVRARGLDQPGRTRALAEAGRILLQLGRDADAKKLIEEAAKDAEQMGGVGDQAIARGTVAAVLAGWNLDRAIGLIEPIKDRREHEHRLGMVAKALAAKDPEKALAIADSMDTNAYLPDSIRAEVAYRTGMKDLPNAEMIFKRMNKNGAQKYKVEAMGWLAVALAKDQPKRARDLIARALDSPIDDPAPFVESWINYGGGIATAAWVATAAGKTGCADMESVLNRVLAARSKSRSHDLNLQIDSEYKGAAIVALIDRGVGLRMLHDLESRSNVGASVPRESSSKRSLVAWALVDPEHAEKLFKSELAGLEGKSNANLEQTGLVKMCKALATPPQLREEWLRQQIRPSWTPSMDD